jgi:hypothetical protein
MRNNSALWMAAVAGGGLLVAAMVGVVAMVAFKSSGAQKIMRQERDLAEAEKQLAAAQTPATGRGTQPTKPTQPPPAGDPSARQLWDQAVRETAKQIYTDYQTNGVAADQKYKGKLVGTTGKVSKIDVDAAGRASVVFTVGEPIGDFGDLGLEVVICVVDAADKDLLANLSAGNAVALVGYGSGKKLNFPTLEKCRILFTAANEQALNQMFQGGGK